MKAYVDDTTGAIEALVLSMDGEMVRPGTTLRDWPEGLSPEGLIWPAGEPAPIADQAWVIAAALAGLREQRARLLAACDWTQLPDCPLDLLKQAEWAAYRQSLRDLPETVDPLDFEWPAPPSP